MARRKKSAPPVLLPYQQRWIADPTPVKVIEKSRRIGLSWAEAADSALLAAAEKGMDSWYIGYNKDMALEFIKDCANWAKHYSLAAGEIEESEEVFVEGDDQKSILAFVIRFSSGFRVTALSSRPSNLRGKQGRAIIDEAAFHEQLGELLKAALAFLMWGGQVHIISTHNGVDNPFNELINDVRSANKPYSLHRVSFDDALADGLFERICLRTGKPYTKQQEAIWAQEIRDFYGDSASEELDCIPKNSGGAYLSRALIESRMDKQTPVVRWEQTDAFSLLEDHIRAAEAKDWCEATLLPLLMEIPAKRTSFLGEDFARNSDLTVIAPLIQQQNLVKRTPFLVELRNIPFKQQEQILFYIIDRLPNFQGGALDAGGNGQYLGEVAVQRYGLDRIQPVKLSENWYRENMPPFKSAFEDGTLDGLPADEDVLADLRALQVVKGVARLPDKRSKGKDGNKRHGDAAIALVLAVFASREMTSGKVEFEALGKPRLNVRMRDYLG